MSIQDQNRITELERRLAAFMADVEQRLGSIEMASLVERDGPKTYDPAFKSDRKGKK